MPEFTVAVKHNFETAHRLPHLGGKCQSLHGHSWWAEITLAAPYDPDAGTVAEFGTVKTRLRSWIDEHLDHGVMLGLADPLAGPLNAHGCKVYRFGAAHLSDGLGWPTVENVAALLARVGDHLLDADLQARVVRCRVTETHVNAAEWTAGPLSRVRLPVWGPLRTGRPPAVGMPTPGQR
ncbi:6-pyruvoyl trahydropterin synthase family protein [Salinispora arenicola]|uniref:6-pyruvoyl trahydropterin synthase family protein n=1 Tax=Salinispora arenicola TaxID=168697 RepID=UPI0003673C03|nr:6-carboxytetrahydropterin synthase [Salinispora arenicola]